VIFREGLKKLLNEKLEVEVVGDTSTQEDAIILLQKKDVDLMILDISLPKTSGFKLIELVNKKYPKVKMLVLTGQKVVEYCRIALKKGALGYALKEDSYHELSKALDVVVSGVEYVSPSLTSAAAEKYFSTNTSLLPDVLTKTEKIVLIHIAEGLSNKEIAKVRGISVRTIETHRAHILKKLKIKNTALLVRYAATHDLIHIEETS
jgi:two-component system nitrate/nitrite response regulator NarL